jgi:hypothetical protein
MSVLFKKGEINAKMKWNRLKVNNMKFFSHKLENSHVNRAKRNDFFFITALHFLLDGLLLKFLCIMYNFLFLLCGVKNTMRVRKPANRFD